MTEPQQPQDVDVSSRCYAVSKDDMETLKLLVKVMLSDTTKTAVAPLWLEAIQKRIPIRKLAEVIADGMEDDEATDKSREMQRLLRDGYADQFIAGYLGLTA